MWKQCEHWPHTKGQSSPGTLPAGGGESTRPVTQGSPRTGQRWGAGPLGVRHLPSPSSPRAPVCRASHASCFRKDRNQEREHSVWCAHTYTCTHTHTHTGPQAQPSLCPPLRGGWSAAGGGRAEPTVPASQVPGPSTGTLGHQGHSLNLSRDTPTPPPPPKSHPSEQGTIPSDQA